MTAEGGSSGFSVKSMQKVLDRKAFPAQSLVFAEGQPGTIAYIVLRGEVTIITGYGTPTQRALMKLGPGQMFGELALMADSRRTASAFTETGCELLTISQEKLEKKLNEADPFVRYWIEYLSRRVIDLSAPTNTTSGR